MFFVRVSYSNPIYRWSLIVFITKSYSNTRMSDSFCVPISNKRHSFCLGDLSLIYFSGHKGF